MADSIVKTIKTITHTSEITVNFNLSATAYPPAQPFISGFTRKEQPKKETYNYCSSPIDIYDTAGKQHNMIIYYVKTIAENTWQVYIGIDGVDVTPLEEDAGTSPIIKPFVLVFDKQGQLVSSDVINIVYAPTTYSTLIMLELDLTKSTQVGVDFIEKFVIKNGYDPRACTAPAGLFSAYRGATTATSERRTQAPQARLFQEPIISDSPAVIKGKSITS